MKGFLPFFCSCFFLLSVSVADEVDAPQADVQDRILGATDVIEHVHVRSLPRDAVLTEVVVNDKVVDAQYIYEPRSRGEVYVTGLEPRFNPHVKQGLNTYRFTFHTAFGTRHVSGSYQLDTIAPTCDVDENGVVKTVEDGSGVKDTRTRAVTGGFAAQVVDNAGNVGVCLSSEANYRDPQPNSLSPLPSILPESHQHQKTALNAAATGPLDDCKMRLNFVYPYNSSWMDEEDVYQELYLVLQAAQEGVAELEQQLLNHGYVIPGFSNERMRTFAYDSRLGLMQEVDLRNGPLSAVPGTTYSLSVGAFSPQLESTNGMTYSLLLAQSFPVNSSMQAAVLDVVRQDKLAAGEQFYDNDVVVYVGGRLNSNYGTPQGVASPQDGQVVIGLRDPAQRKIISQDELANLVLHEVLHVFGLDHVSDHLLEFPSNFYLMTWGSPSDRVTATQAAVMLARMCGVPRELRNVHGASPYMTKRWVYSWLFQPLCSEMPAGIHTTVIDPFVTGNASGPLAGVRAGLDLDTLPIGLGSGTPYQYAGSPAGGPDELLCVAGERGLTYRSYMHPIRYTDGVRGSVDTNDRVVILASVSGQQHKTYELTLVDPETIANSYQLDTGAGSVSHEQYLESIWTAGLKLTFRADPESLVDIDVIQRAGYPANIKVTVTLSNGEEYVLVDGHPFDSDAAPILVMEEELAQGVLIGEGYFVP